MDASNQTPMQTMSCTTEQLDYLFHHLILPSKLPGHDDTLATNEEFLINFVIQSLSRFRDLSDEDDDAVTNHCISMLKNTRDARDSNRHLDCRSVQNSFQRLSEMEDAASMYYITEQNAGLIIRRLETSYSFETFELSPTNRAAMATKGRLIREFPATATEVSAKDFNDFSFQEVLTNTLVKMSHQAVTKMQPKVRKAQQMHNEERDTTDPRIVTELLTSFLRGAGTPAEIKAVQKRTREEVSWNNSSHPWTRSPLWLLLRVGLQLTMVRHPKGSQELYKRFMVFLMAQALQIACEKSSSSEVVHLMMAKISRRLCKLGDIEDGAWLHEIKDIVSSASRKLKQRWINIQHRNQQPLDLDVLAQFKFEEHTDISLPELDTFIATIPRRQQLASSKVFKAKPIALTLDTLSLPTVNGSVNNDNKSFELAAVETWVQNNLGTWLEHHLSSEQSCHGHPERMSKMLLTLGEIWVAIDKMAVHHNPLMLKYRNEIPREVFSDLLLHSKTNMERLHRLEEYLEDTSGKLKLSALLSYGQRLSFAVEYFRQCPKLQEKKQQIERSAQTDRDKKLKQFRELKSKYDAIMKQHDDMQCEKVLQVQQDVEYYVHVKNKCRRCALLAKAKKVKISPHEWPLPADELEAQTSVFEMDVPVAFAVWRDATVYFLDNILRFESSCAGDYPRASFPLTTYKPLSPWFESQRHRVQLLSEIKPHSRKHRNQKSIETCTEADVCLNNGLRFQYHDGSRNTFLSTFKPTTEISKHCTIKLPTRAQALQRFMARTWYCVNGETPNQAIASQSDCPEYMSLGEFKAIAVLPYGYRLQWMNILTQLAMPTVDFNKPETALILLQMMLQAGPFDEDETTRHAHTRPTEVEFGSQILKYLSESVSRVQENWESYTSLCSFTCLATRLLALAGNSLSTQILELIAECREISYKWVMHLLSKAQDIEHRRQRTEFLEAAVHIALVCIETFNLEGEHFEQALAEEQQAAILLEISIITHNYADFQQLQGDALHGIMLDRYKITMHRALPILANEITSNGSSCLDVAIMRRWPDFAREVHVSLLTGQLLVNGSPVSRLPQKYETHREYQKLFGSATMEVMPSNLPGMSFCATRKFHAYTVHLGMQTKKGVDDLLVRLSKSGSTLDLIPSRSLQDLLPDDFSDNHVHWLEEASGEIEFCHVNTPWPSLNTESWHLRKSVDAWKLLLAKESLLVFPWSELGQKISKIFSRLQPASDLHLVLHQQSKELEVRLPKLRLEFTIRSGTPNIKSRQFCDMEIDQNQAIGTLIGLENKLVLRNYHDSTIRMVPSDKVESKLYLAYLHALTSYCLPDSFLQRTGTEEALTILGSASIKAPTEFSQSACTMVSNIAHLSPKRSYYPADQREMQRVHWRNDLSYTIQDDRFGKEVRNILKKYGEVQFLFPKNALPSLDQHHSIDELVDRAILRTSGTRVSTFGAEDFTTKYDVRYASREKIKSLERSTRTVEMAYRVYNKSGTLSRPVSGRLGHLLFSLMSGDERVHTKEILPKSRIDYDSSWLEGPESYLSSVWFQLHNSYKKSVTWFDKYQLMMWMATMSYSTDYDPQVGQALLLLAQFRSLADCNLLGASTYNLTAGCQIRDEDLRAAIAPYVVSYASSPDAISARRFDEGGSELGQRRREDYRKRSAKAIDTFVKHLKQQWPSVDPKKPEDPHMELTSYIRMGPAMESAIGKWNQWLKNLRLRKHLDVVASYMREHVPGGFIQVSPALPRTLIPISRSASRFVATSDLFSSLGVLHRRAPPALCRLLVNSERDGQSNKLGSIIDNLDSKAKLDYEHRYLRELKDSLSSLHDHVESELQQQQLQKLPGLLQDHLERCESHLRTLHETLPSSVSSSSTLSHAMYTVLEEAGFLPRLSPTQILQQLRPAQWKTLSAGWKESLIHYGIAITSLQRAKRLIRFQSSHVDLIRELENGGHQRWCPYDHPEWLLLECESEIIIRDVQQQIAEQMINPPDNQNSVMQLNMGEGKSTVIVPIVATALGDGTKLVRVIVAKPQAKQMHQMLISKLSGLLDRPVYLLPFSRDTKMDIQTADAIQCLMKRCMEEGGVLMVQPEHLLSFQLMEVESRIRGDMQVAEAMSQTRNLFDLLSRDIADESDENLSVKFEIIYTLGKQRPIEHNPDRWVIIQEVMGLIAKFGPEIKSKYPHSIEFDARHIGRYPHLRILQPDAETEIFNRVTEAVCDTGMAGFPIARQPRPIRDAVQRYISQPEPTAADLEGVETSSLWNELTSRNILLLRGLFAGGILSFALGSKRWRVNYGVDHNREKTTKLAVPFRAKDNPTPRSEFSQPDVVITLTCLSYYYSGLDDDALFAAFKLLSRSDNTTQEYQGWVKTAPSLPQAFRNLEGVNLRDRVQCTTEIFPHVRYSKAGVDYYLCHLVFAKESKEFPHKLSASGWDLEYLLQPENGISLMPQEAKGTTFDSSLLLQMVSNMSSNTRVILDVGAQVVDLTNQQFTKQWLACYQDHASTQAVVFFNDNDEIVVIDRSGKTEDFQTSPFSQQLDLCLVFLDEAHTRGTDLKLPANYRAVVTLGAGLTKDRLVQACMRMRKLGKGQTVEFCIPWEIEHNIVQLKGEGAPSREALSVSDVLCWALTETCLDLKRSMPLWLTQGVRFSKQESIWSRLSDNDPKADMFLEEESQSLRERYLPQKGLTDFSSLTEGLNDSVAKVFKSRCEDFGLERLRTCSLQEEQERELAPETQHERQVEKVPALKPDTHSVNRFLQEWIADGSFPESSTAFRTVMKPAFQSLNKTSAAVHFDVKEFPETVWVSMDFAHTVKEESEHVTLHLYAPRVNLGFGPLDDLQLYSVGKKVVEEMPRHIITFLNLFAGQLYLSSYDDYKLVCDLLGLAWDAADDGSRSQCDFTKSPATFLKELLEKVRQDCGTIDKTDMGRVIEGKSLHDTIAILYQDQTSLDQGTSVQRFQLCMVLAIAIRLLNRTDSSVPTTASDSFFASAIGILTERPQATWRGDLEHLQNLLLIVQYTIFASNLSAAWHFIGLATRLAIDLDLLNETRLSVIDDANENEAVVNKRRRVFWSTYILETNLCVILNRPRSIPDQAIFTPLPFTVGPESSSPLVNHCILFRQLEYEIFHTLNYKTPANGSFFDYKAWKMGMKDRLVEWHANVPPLDPTSKLVPQNFFDGALHMSLVSLFSPSRHFPHLSENELRDLAQYASTSIELYREGFKEGKLRFYWRTTPNLFQSGAALIHCIKSRTLQGAVFDVNALKSRVSVCSTVLWGMAERYPPGASYRDRFDEMSATIDELASEVPMDISSDFLFGHNVLPWLDLDGAATLWTSTPPTLDPWILDQK
ncbi:hypothetical protein FAGAP_10050 [Fusarium agapanthi]|uniref:ubiquitinyl hydrolase 1 n=1 Tax=Fusarium agapanthi TaxID=1803897 RepID=A0A9P5E440_9HYPO|nr:hypothetical protein FAGAP_10050 [Fusarium agapanthi]